MREGEEMVKYGDFEGVVEDLIRCELDEIERARGVRILWAVESGSRAWGFASPDSDYDVRFVYLSPLEHYLSVHPKKDTIEWVVDETLDICGWDLSKFLELGRKGNMYVYEWPISPIVYRSTEEWVRVWDVVQGYFSCKKAMYNYYGLARTTEAGALQGESVRYKKYLYVLRPLLACKYIDERRDRPPVDIHPLIDAVAPDDLKAAIDVLLARKSQMTEKDLGPRIPEIDAFIEEALVKYGEKSKQMDYDVNKDWGPLDAVFMQTVLGRQRAEEGAELAAPKS